MFQRFRLRGWSGLYHSLKYNLYRRERVIRFQADLDHWQPLAETPASLEICREALEELIRFRETWTGGSLSEDFYVDKVFGVSRVWLGLWESKVAHVDWITCEKPTLNVPLAPGSCELRNGFTFEEYRGRRIGPHVISAILSDLKREGMSTVVAHVAESNSASRKMMTKAGFQAVETITITRVVGFVRLRRKPYAEVK